MTQKEEWHPVSTFGSGVILANGDKRKIVTPDKTDFSYTVPAEGEKSDQADPGETG